MQRCSCSLLVYAETSDSALCCTAASTLHEMAAPMLPVTVCRSLLGDLSQAASLQAPVMIA